MTTILKGENKHLVRRLLQADGSPLLRTALAALRVELWQGTALRTTYVYGTNPELVANPGDLTGNEVRLEITTTLSNSLPPGKVTEIWQLSMTDSAYVEGARIDRLVASDITIR
jgi:hypothetical protein